MTAPIAFSCTLGVYFMLLSQLLLGYYCTGFLRTVTTSAFAHKIKTKIKIKVWSVAHL